MCMKIKYSTHLVKQMTYICNKYHVYYVHVTIDFYCHDHVTMWLHISTCTCKYNVIIVHQWDDDVIPHTEQHTYNTIVTKQWLQNIALSFSANPYCSEWVYLQR